MQDETETRVDEPTPNGGAYSIAYWQGANGEPVNREVAVGAEIKEFDADGKEIFRTYMSKKP